MKRILTIAAATAIALVGCSKNNEFKVSADNLPNELNNQTVYFIEEMTPTPFDSVVVTNGSFEKTFADPTSDHSIFVSLGSSGFVRVIPESAHVRIVKTDDEMMPFEVTSNAPNSLNIQLQQYTKETNTALIPIQKEYSEAVKNYRSLLASEDPGEEKVKAVEDQINAIGERYTKTSNEINRKYYDANKDNFIGVLAFRELSFDNDQEWVDAYENSGQLIKDNEQNKARYEKLVVAAETAVGKQYKDYTIEDGLGNSAQLSDYLKDGRYLLVDFWASWCGPCRQAMPHLAKLNQEKANTLRVLSIGVWEEKIEDNNKAKQELNMTWETLFDKESKGVELYGIEGIPTILLISPEGEIVVRTHSPAAIDEKLAELNL